MRGLAAPLPPAPRRAAGRAGRATCRRAARSRAPQGGLFVWVTLPPGIDAEAILPRAIERGVAFVPGRYFYAGEPVRETLRVSFATASPAELVEGAARLGAAIAG